MHHQEIFFLAISNVLSTNILAQNAGPLLLFASLLKFDSAYPKLVELGTCYTFAGMFKAATELLIQSLWSEAISLHVNGINKKH